MGKIKLDKYYTPPELAEYIINKTKEIIGEENISEWLEPSAGSGVFLNYLPKEALSYDIDPDDYRIKKQDYLTLKIEHKQGRCVIGNPPFGIRNTLLVQFYKKSIQIADYISFILPLSQLNNNQQMYEFDLVYSEDLGFKKYSDKTLRCCFNIYKRNPSGLNKKIKCKLDDVEIKENRRNGVSIGDINTYDIGICSFGKGIIGRQPNYVGQYVKEMYFKIHNENLKSKLIDIIVNTDWETEVCNGTTGQFNLCQWQVYKYIKEKIPELK